jgi:hypothetical protein
MLDDRSALNFGEVTGLAITNLCASFARNA